MKHAIKWFLVGMAIGVILFLFGTSCGYCQTSAEFRQGESVRVSFYNKYDSSGTWKPWPEDVTFSIFLIHDATGGYAQFSQIDLGRDTTRVFANLTDTTGFYVRAIRGGLSSEKSATVWANFLPPEIVPPVVPVEIPFACNGNEIFAKGFRATGRVTAADPQWPNSVCMWVAPEEPVASIAKDFQFPRTTAYRLTLYVRDDNIPVQFICGAKESTVRTAGGKVVFEFDMTLGLHTVIVRTSNNLIISRYELIPVGIGLLFPPSGVSIQVVP